VFNETDAKAGKKWLRQAQTSWSAISRLTNGGADRRGRTALKRRMSGPPRRLGQAAAGRQSRNLVWQQAGRWHEPLDAAFI